MCLHVYYCVVGTGKKLASYIELHKLLCPEPVLFKLISSMSFISNRQVFVSRGVTYCNMWSKSSWNEIRWLTVRGGIRKTDWLAANVTKSISSLLVFSLIFVFNFDFFNLVGLWKNIYVRQCCHFFKINVNSHLYKSNWYWQDWCRNTGIRPNLLYAIHSPYFSGICSTKLLLLKAKLLYSVSLTCLL